MGDHSEKKRKRNNDAEEESARPRKSRVLETDGVASSETKPKKSGEAKQAKSERRSKKAKPKDSHGVEKKVKKSKTKYNNGAEKKAKKVSEGASLQNADGISNGEDFVKLEGNAHAVKKPSKEETSKSKIKSKKADAAPIKETEDSAPTGDDTTATDTSVKKSKSKSKTKSKKAASTSTEEATESATAPRFIVFVGNLPYTATTEQITDHFVKLSPSSVRHSTEKQTGKSKGFAFLEFEAYDRMKTCLKLYHHSIFDPNAKTSADEKTTDADLKDETKRKGRRINVELTAGGGGKSKDRKEKIKEKNEKLDEERQRRIANERAEQEKAWKEKKARPATGPNAESGEPADNRGAIHPSRMSRVSY